MSYALAFHPQVRRHLKNIPPRWHPHLEGALRILAQDPVAHSSVLKGEWQNLSAYSAPPYHLIYRLYDREQAIAVIAITTIK